MVAECGVADLGEDTLKLATGGGDPTGHFVRRQVTVVLLAHDRDGVLEQGSPRGARGARPGFHAGQRAGGRPKDRASVR
jgi:hypothetical protein